MRLYVAMQLQTDEIAVGMVRWLWSAISGPTVKKQD